MKLQKKNLLAQKRRWRIRKTVRGTAARPRLALKMTHMHLYAQAIDDDKGVTLVSLASTSKDLRGQKLKANVGGAAILAHDNVTLLSASRPRPPVSRPSSSTAPAAVTTAPSSPSPKPPARPA